MNRITTGVIVSLLIVAAALGWTTSHYHDNAVKYKDQRDTATHNLKLANATITDMTKRQRDVAALDAKYTKELADAQTRNTDLQRRLAAGGRVRVKGRCTVPASTLNAGHFSLLRMDEAFQPLGYFHEVYQFLASGYVFEVYEN